MLTCFIPVAFNLPAKAAPADDTKSHVARKVPVISSYPPEILSISLSNRSCIEELTNPTIKRFNETLLFRDIFNGPFPQL